MSNVTLSWERLWLYHKQSDREIQEDIIKQLDLQDFLPRVPVQVRKEIMKHAPVEVRVTIERIVPLTKTDETYQSELKRIFGG